MSIFSNCLKIPVPWTRAVRCRPHTQFLTRARVEAKERMPESVHLGLDDERQTYHKTNFRV
jgi:hypothetical protein